MSVIESEEVFFFAVIYSENSLDRQKIALFLRKYSLLSFEYANSKHEHYPCMGLGANL